VTSFTQELWASIEPIYRAILSHHFLKGLADGTLPEEKFRLHWGSRGAKPPWRGVVGGVPPRNIKGASLPH